MKNAVLYPKQWQALQAFLQESSAAQPLALAFSGGLDSRFVAHAAQQAKVPMVLYHAQGPHVPQAESRYAQDWAKEQGLTLQVFSVDVCALPHVQNNSELRCYYCKKHLLTLFTQAAQAHGLRLCDGTNADDMHAHRPGLRALEEHNILSPLAACGITKSTVRELAGQTGLAWPAQKASPCLLTRLHYGMQVCPELLQRLGAAEEALHGAGVQECRLRLRPEPLLQMTIASISAQQVQDILAQHGFSSVEVVVEEKLSGYFDRKA